MKIIKDLIRYMVESALFAAVTLFVNYIYPMESPSSLSVWAELFAMAFAIVFVARCVWGLLFHDYGDVWEARLRDQLYYRIVIDALQYQIREIIKESRRE
jgi:hypothetical protein